MIGASFLASVEPLSAHENESPASHPVIRNSAWSSLNWSGYAVTGTAGSVTNALGSWTVPSVTCTSTSSYAAFWVGIDGFTSSTVEQTGTMSQCQRGSPSYYAWYEFYPGPLTTITSIPVSPGNSISAGVSYSGGTFTVTITDVTTGKTFSTSQRVGSAQRSSAEWIAEAPSSGSTILPLANFGTSYFGVDNTGVTSTNYATIGGVSGPISSFGSSVQEMTMVTSSGALEAQPSALSADGTSFSVAWVAPSTTTTTTTTTTTRSTSSTSTRTSSSTISTSSTTTTTSESQLVVAISTNHQSYSRGSTVSITVQVTANTGSAVSHASVSLSITPPSGRATIETGNTNRQGTVSFTYNIPRNGPTGTYTVSATASASGFVSGSGSTTFSVT